jgi:hypothetical protein
MFLHDGPIKIERAFLLKLYNIVLNLILQYHQFIEHNQLNPKYVIIVNQDINKLLVASTTIIHDFFY